MRKANLSEGHRARVRPADDPRRALAQHLAARFVASGDRDEAMIQTATSEILDVEDRLGPLGPDLLPVVVPLVVKALRRHRREQFRTPRQFACALPGLQLAIASAESDMYRRLRRSPTIDEIAGYLGLAEHQVIAGLEAGWSACASRPAAP
ncbi:hypothetical protein GCM10010172_16340 [Paractinoplanes ferrugineus]|uniref:Uncharacterized protein n=1 Tax=Paractinoplanes ferrugineus TaxID=113564 RepID=A0A919IZK6_9ACTN|nr:hypothetical protein [Actinoplanes ferrugineus]GIE10198.1 hypothetical protein Afe05nite_20380 [Actinoplanes ferrugineus]